MGIGVGVLFIAIGAILAFAVDAQVSGIDVQAIGWILIVVGILGIVLDLVLFAPRRRRVVETRTTTAAPAVVQQPVQPVQPVVQQPVQQAPPQQTPPQQAPEDPPR